jgi:hypothetical protein
MFRRAVSPGDEQQSTARDIASARCRALISTKDAMKQAARHNQQGPHGKQGEQDEPGEQGPRRLAASLRRACSVLTARSSTPHELEVPHWTATLFRWSLGLALVSWRYLWLTTPLHRREEAGDVHDLPPPLPEHWVDERNQPLEHGAGPLFHRVFAVCIDEPTMMAQELISVLAADLNQAVPSEVTSVDKQSDRCDPLAVGDEMVVRMPGPWDGPVRVVDCAETSFRFATLDDHMEAGQIEFPARP